MQKCHHKHDMNILCILRTLQPFCEIFRVETHTLSTQHITTSSTTYRDAVSGIWMWFGAEMPWQSSPEHSVHTMCAVYVVHDFMRFVGWKHAHWVRSEVLCYLLHAGMLCELSGCDLVQKRLGNRAMNIRCMLDVLYIMQWMISWGKQTHLAHIMSEHHLLHTGMLCELSGCDLVQRCLGNRAMNIR